MIWWHLPLTLRKPHMSTARALQASIVRVLRPKFTTQMAPREAITYHLGRLLASLEQLREEEHVASDDEEPACWHDEKYLYFELAMADFPGTELDLNIHDGSVFVRREL